ncbi:hypothetical protein [Pseudomonas rhodesiae]|uniref:hypothetical protein n=1 Tax=Pseudomonas rhodesiae TaxID=76760 RepID=UPI000F49D8CA|nr:hypothetical protein [Pseudomonas rhodesiae]ROM56674.1 hypothetical protein BK650_11175 [Pseudomonas rhodesiae]ROM62877.1 hypothetical protein BK651_18615 [Pseudomonas rhodesiae]
MKPQMALKPLVFALAALMAAAAQAGSWHPAPQPTGTIAAAVSGEQNSVGNRFDNTKTENNASADGSVNRNNGNVGNIAQAGDAQQAQNSVAIASASGDAATVFGETDVTQNSLLNTSVTKGTQNNASLDGSVNNNSGNVGSIGQAGQANQAANSVAIVTADGKSIVATASTVQNSLGNSYLSTAATSHGYGHGYGGKPQYVSNNASLDSSLNGNSGNVGNTLQAGQGNMAGNALSISQGCTTCASGVRF